MLTSLNRIPSRAPKSTTPDRHPLRSKTIDRHRLVAVDKKYALMSSDAQYQVSSQLEEQLDYLLGKKERELMRKRKLKQMEEVYELERNSRLSRINLKISRSDKNRACSLRDRKNKTRMELENVERIRKKNEHDNEESLERKLSIQKKRDQQRTVSRSSTSSLDPHSSRDRRQVGRNGPDAASIDSLIEDIEAKMDQAQTNSQFYYSSIAQKASSRSKDFEGMMNKLRAQSVLDETKCIKDYYKRATHIVECSQKSKSFYVKESERKRQNIEEKFRRAKHNLGEVDRLRQSKLDQLQAKLDKTFTPKAWRNERSQTYLNKFLSNQKELEHEKTLKTELMMRKHADLNLKNRALRQKKDKILQTIKTIQL